MSEMMYVNNEKVDSVTVTRQFIGFEGGKILFCKLSSEHLPPLYVNINRKQIFSSTNINNQELLNQLIRQYEDLGLKIDWRSFVLAT